MGTVELTPALRSEYERLFAECKVRPERLAAVNLIVDALVASQARYAAVAKALSIPWQFIGAIHNMESSRSFTRHLHNGDPLTARTTHVPAGRPKAGKPPFTWEASAEDALQMKGLGATTDWTVGGTLYQLERYNGFGYRQHHPKVLTPYLWSFSNHYKSGKYVADGKWSSVAVSAQCGAAVLLRRMADRGIIYSTQTAELPKLPVSPQHP